MRRPVRINYLWQIIGAARSPIPANHGELEETASGRAELFWSLPGGGTDSRTLTAKELKSALAYRQIEFIGVPRPQWPRRLPEPSRPLHASGIHASDLMYPTLIERPFSRPGWSFELKLGGFRALARRDHKGVELISRAGRPLDATYPEVVDALQTILGSWVLDGELIVTDSHGHPSLDALRRRAAMTLRKTIVAAFTEAPVALCVFDVLYARNTDVRALPLSKRRELLEDLLKPRPGLQLVRSIEEHGEAAFAKACELGLEGIVGKQDDSPYQRGKRPTWVKIKNPDYSRQDALRKRS